MPGDRHLKAQASAVLPDHTDRSIQRGDAFAHVPEAIAYGILRSLWQADPIVTEFDMKPIAPAEPQPDGSGMCVLHDVVQCFLHYKENIAPLFAAQLRVWPWTGCFHRDG